MKFLCILAILLAAECIATSSAEPACCQCFFKLVDILKANGIITNDNFAAPCHQQEDLEPSCPVDPLTLSRLSNMQLKKTISDIKRPVDLLVDGNSVLLAARKDKAILRLDEDGKEIAKYTLPNEPKFLELHDNRLYVTTAKSDRVMRSNDIREDGDLTFTNFLTLNFHANAIRFTPDGKEFLIGSNVNKIYVYNSETLDLVHEIATHEKKSRYIEFSADNTIYVTHASNKVSVYSIDYKHLQTLTFGTTDEEFHGLILQCDGSKILVNKNGKFFFVDKDDNLIGSFDNSDVNYVALRDMTVTSGGSVFITDHYGNKLYIFQ